MSLFRAFGFHHLTFSTPNACCKLGRRGVYGHAIGSRSKLSDVAGVSDLVHCFARRFVFTSFVFLNVTSGLAFGSDVDPFCLALLCSCSVYTHTPLQNNPLPACYSYHVRAIQPNALSLYSPAPFTPAPASCHYCAPSLPQPLPLALHPLLHPIHHRCSSSQPGAAAAHRVRATGGHSHRRHL
jgi:hypothetical protein